MKIKIMSDINLKINKVVLKRDVIDKSLKGKDRVLPDSNKLFGVVQYRNGTESISKLLVVENDGVKYVSALPNPTHLFLSNAVVQYEISEEKKNKNFPDCGLEMDIENTAILDFEKGETHECFTDYLKTRTTSIILLISALENFMNKKIPKDYILIWFDDGKKINKKANYNKIVNFSFNKKLIFVMPKVCGLKDLWINNSVELEIIKELYNHRKEFVHLKTGSNEEWKSYLEAFGKMVKFDLGKAIKAVIKIMNIISPGFVIEDGNN